MTFVSEVFRSRIHRIVALTPALFVTLSAAVPSTAQIERPLYPLYEALANSKVSASMEFSGSCEPNSPFFPKPQAPTIVNGTALDVAREMFEAGGPHMQVTADADGMIRIKEPGVQDDILNVKIGRIKIGGDTTETATYAANIVIFPVMSAPEVAGFIKAHDIELQTHALFFSGSSLTPGLEFPHLSGSLENVTASDVFDYVLRTFPGIWLYKNCPAHDGNKRRVDVRFFTNHKLIFIRSIGWRVNPNPLK